MVTASHIVACGFPAFGVINPEHLAIGGKSFGKPNVIEIQEAHGIAKPLVYKLMRHGQFVSAHTVYYIIAQSGHGLVFHGAESAHIHRGIAIFFKRIESEESAVIFYHFRQSAQIVNGVLLLMWAYKVHDGKLAVQRCLRDLHIISGGDAYQVGGHGMFPAPDGGGSAVAIVCDAFAQSVRRNFPIRAHSNDEINHRLIPRMVVARPPKAGCVGIAHREYTIGAHIHTNVVR